MKRIFSLFAAACMAFAMQAQTVITPSQAAELAKNGDKGTYTIEGYVGSVVDRYSKSFENQSFMMSDEPDGEDVFEAWRFKCVDYTISKGSKVRIIDAKLSVYNGVYETGAGYTVEIIEERFNDLNLPVSSSFLSVQEAEALALSLPKDDEPTDELYVVSGYAVSEYEVYDDGSQTVWISDNPTEGGAEFQAYLCYPDVSDKDGTITAVKKGDFIYVMGNIRRYGKIPEIRGGLIYFEQPEKIEVEVVCDGWKGSVSISGYQSFVLQDMAKLENGEVGYNPLFHIDIEATAFEGYEFLGWVDMRHVNSDNEDYATEEKALETMKRDYEKFKNFTQEDLEAEEISQEDLQIMMGLSEALFSSKARFDAMMMAFYINHENEDYPITLKAVFKVAGTGINDVAAEMRTEKIVEGGQLYILRGVRKYNILGDNVK